MKKDLALTALTVLWQISEGHAVVGQDRMDFIRKHLDDVPQEGRPVHLSCLIVELHIGELRHPVDGEKHDQPPFGMTKFAGIDVNISDFCLGEASPL